MNIEKRIMSIGNDLRILKNELRILKYHLQILENDHGFPKFLSIFFKIHNYSSILKRF